MDGCDAVIHIAALYSYDATRDDRAGQRRRDTPTSSRPALSKGVRRLVHTSTAGTCGPVPGREATEADEPPEWELDIPYKRTKLAAERLVLDAAESSTRSS